MRKEAIALQSSSTVRAFILRKNVTIALRLAPERARGMGEGVVVHLNERLERDVEAPAIIKAPTKRCIITE